MKVSVLKRDKRLDIRNDRSLGIQTFGETNDYPQQVMQVVDASGTGKSCVNIYAKFMSGRGFVDTDFYKKTINEKGETNDHILNAISKDYALFGGFAIHVNYNANYKVSDIQHIPFEHIRFEKMDENGFFDKVAIHPDWGRQYLQLRKFNKEDIVKIHFYDPNPLVIEEQVQTSGGWDAYKGQIYYFSNKGNRTYPLPIFDPVLTDMNTEEGVTNVSNRNVKNNFFPSGLLVDINNTDQSEDQENDTAKSIKELQGDEKACKMGYVQVSSKEEVPLFIPFTTNNYDKEFTITTQSVQANIGRSFNQPPILRAEDVGSNFGADAIKNAYDYYNSVIENERLDIERVFTSIFSNWYEPITNNIEINPLTYDVKMTLVERLGDNGFEQLMKIIENVKLQPMSKRNMAKTLFDLSDNELSNLIPLTV